MTLVLSINGPETIWMLTDRRLKFSDGRIRDDGRKMISLETTDGVALLGYAGLGRTARGTEPADWMNSVLRGRNMPLEDCLVVIAEALKQQMPKHLAKIPPQYLAGHFIMVPAFLNNEIRLYQISLVLKPDRKSYSFVCTRLLSGRPRDGIQRTPRFGSAGSGGYFLEKDRHWQRNLLRIVRACDRGLVEPRVVADCLANLNMQAAAATSDQTVGPRSIVMWRHRKGGLHNGGGGHQFYTGTDREPRDSGAMPTLANGLDIQALCGALMPMMVQQAKVLRQGGQATEMDVDAMNAAIGKLPYSPDENLN